MNTAKKIEAIWNELTSFIDRAYSDDPSANGALRDYVSNTGWHHDLANLLDRETENERKHRNGAPNGFRAPISSPVAAKLILAGNFSRGSERDACPLAIDLLLFRHTAVEMETIGWLCRKQVTQEWRDRVAALDYAQIMRAA